MTTIERDAAVKESPLMFVVNSRGNKLFSPLGPQGLLPDQKCAQGRR
jgi:hypothetical protein